MRKIMKYNLINILFIAVALIAAAMVGSSYYYLSPFYTPVTQAVAVIHPTKNNNVRGIVKFEKINSAIKITAKLRGLTPGQHGFHIHESGDCSCADAECAGGHYNPTNQPHGSPDDSKRHIGDLGNIIADENGNAIYVRLDKHLKLNGPHSIIGRSVLVHADKDDLKSQPSGKAGKRLGCGVIGIKA